MRPNRAEPLHDLAAYHRAREKYHEAYKYAKQASTIPQPSDRLFVNKDIYDWKILDEIAVAAYWAGYYSESKEVCETILQRQEQKEIHLSEQQLKRIKDNLNFSLNKIPEDSSKELGKEVRHLYQCCPLCESSNFTFSFEADCRAHLLYNPKLPGTIRWSYCNKCGHSFTEGYFTNEALGTLMEQAHDYQLLDVGKLEQAREVSAMIVDKISGVLGKQEGQWLDVGFGNGALLLTSAEYGF